MNLSFEWQKPMSASPFDFVLLYDALTCWRDGPNAFCMLFLNMFQHHISLLYSNDYHLIAVERRLLAFHVVAVVE